ncbi:MAG: DUF3857 domain-containing protein, partial [Bacteroidota bacterium]|nr:DUF3857 domain-containing protein [Bacteroidota bacterium]
MDVSKIPDSLKENACVIKRFEEITLEIKAPGKYLLHQKHIYTILNENGDNEASYQASYDKFSSVDYLEGQLYNADGKVLKKVKKKEMGDFAYQDGFSLVSDDRYISNDFAWRDYPYSVSYEEDDTRDGVLEFPAWVPQETPSMSVQYSKYVIIAPKGYQVRYKELNFSQSPVIKEGRDQVTYTWEMDNVPAKKGQDEGFVTDYRLPSMMVAPSDFEEQGYSGNMDSWPNYGKFIYQLKEGKDSLPEDFKRQIHQMTDSLSNPLDKIRVLYQYLQQNTRYISIQLGIGGWQPFSANYVATKKYGDCKALSNFMVAMLKVAGLDGKYVEIRAGAHARPIEKDFPASQFDHVICCVPLKKDTVWLECTTGDYPSGFLGSFTANRWGVLIDKNGGTLVHTPNYDYHQNLEASHLRMTLDGQGNLSGTVHLFFRAEAAEDLLQYLNENSENDARDYIRKSIVLPTFDIQQLKFSKDMSELPSVSADFQLTVSNYAQVSGKRIFITP